MYTLYYIRGINRNDTPYFLNITQQEEYFESKKVKEIEGNYPPHFKNNIRLETDDLDFETQVNYLSLEFGGKTYYYFIDSVHYQNEDIRTIDITMDTIQTYMFNIQFNESDVSRMNIERWNGNEINRNYIRENLSEGIMINENFVQDYDNFDFILIKASTSIDTSSYSSTKIVNDNSMFETGQYFYFLPYNLNGNIVGIYYIDNNGNEKWVDITSYRNMINDIIRNPNINEIRYFNKCTIKGLSYSIENNIIRITFGSFSGGSIVEYSTSSTGIINKFIPLLSVSTSIFDDKNYDITINNENFYKNILKSNEYSSKYVPQLIDENYINIKFGERQGYTGFPLSKLGNSSIICKYYYSIVDGSRIYKILENNNEKDIYLTTICNMSDESLTLISDAWNEYYSRNRGYLTTGIALAKQKNLYNVGKQAVMSGAKTGVGLAFGNANLVGNGLFDLAGNISDYSFENYSIDRQLKATKENLEYTPDTEKQGNFAFNDIISNSISRIISQENVKDIEDVGFKLEKFGYKVHEHYFSENIFNTLNIRYYYNIIQCENMNINLNILDDETTKNKIIDRFKIGIRLWNVTNSDFTYIGDYSYDNVEKSYL